MTDEFADDDEADALEFKTAVRRVKARLAEVEQKMTHPARAAVLGDLVDAEDLVAAWQALSLGRKRAVIDVLMTVTIHPAGPGRRAFDPTTVKIDWKH
jgi:hypothetical protein